MSCFKLPSSICEQINKACAKFWWGSSDSKKKAHWIGWSKLCSSKGRDGLGFRDLRHFNQALLAKISWRILKNPNSLLAKVLRGRYFQDGSFLQASLGSNPSLTWRSILWGRELFKKGIRWKIGNGHHVRIDQDPWISRKGSCVPVWVKDSLKGHYLSSIINLEGDWNSEIIHESFSPVDVEDIMNSIVGGSEHQDEIIWNFEDNGIFSVKSAYHLASDSHLHLKASSSSVGELNRMWKRFWKLKATPKVKICAWKIIHDSIPTRTNIRKKRNWY